MRHAITLLLTVICFGCTTHQPASRFGVIDVGMSAQQVRDIVRERDGEIFSDEIHPYYPTSRSMTAVISGSGPGSYLLMAFENDRLVVMMHDYYLRSHAEPPGISKMECEANFKSIQRELETLYGPPTHSERRSEGKDRLTILKWQRASRFIFAKEYVDGDYCGAIAVSVFSGTEEEFEKSIAQNDARNKAVMERATK